MKILFAKLCAFFLVAVTTVSIGAPLENTNTNTSMLTHLYKRETFPTCNRAPYTRLIDSSCYGWSQMLVTCESPYNTALFITELQDCRPNERCVPFSYFDFVTAEQVDHAKCVVNKKRTREWRSDGDHPRKRVCSQRVSYVGNNDILTSVGTYTTLGNTVNVDEIEVYKDGKLHDYNINQCNLSSTVPGYNGEPIQYCFTTSSVTVVVGIAAAENPKDSSGVGPDEVLQVKEL